MQRWALLGAELLCLYSLCLNRYTEHLSIHTYEHIHSYNTVWQPIMLSTYHTKGTHASPPEHLQVHIQDHSHLSLNNATGIPRIPEHSESVFLLMLLTAAWATLSKIAQDHLEVKKQRKNYKDTGSLKYCYRCWSFKYPIQFIHVFNNGLS